MNKKGLTASFIFEAESGNYGEGIGNVTALKKVSRGSGESYSYFSRQALRYNIIEQLGEDNTPLDVDGSVIQFAPEATIKDYPEIDFFGYMKTKKPSKTRSAVVRLSNAISLESFNADLDFLTNKGLLDRYNMQSGNTKDGGNIAQSEIHKSYYAYTITIDLDKIGIDKNDDIEISNDEKSERIKRLLDTLKFLYRDIKGRRENLSPIFAIGGVYDIKNPFFENKLKVEENKLGIQTIEDVLSLDDAIKDNTYVGLIKGIFSNDEEIQNNLKCSDIGQFFKDLKSKVDEYYNESK
ncbi:type I-B CRISPR-associated protein Cas7/Cst2/DevR [Clostridium botulinum]|uniref:CRISPR-associated protein n=1 Tax=Clostridium botulinum C/D str. DC5 TaxID=1443128 RepID=A0A0A0IE25_CLOBO|nr:type I-B CRISPR-associated protein Cas7/Cst2/DevR [Clostridium botulinum]KEI06836.1 CRISPR-associated protein [Clostridium botulinum C/D str. BKT75002]KEI11591.1 CRISPR-associated protein [Clostridium botulinum C/D str. BKT2873]KGM99197.1 CRISPR-associated protein [Clostridium botulinum C/D str. DC5]KOC51040.1 CRISPR-associated protein [Clostridium botulinum]KOC53217.1 CRISPR-associated protein [Clostridium botulinum]